MRLRARPQLHYAPVPGGVYFSGARAQFAIRGPEILFTIADVCVPLLEDGATEDDLVAALGSERARPAVRQLTAGLRGHGMLLDLDALTEPEPPAEVRSRHPEALAHLETVSDDPYARFAALRTKSVLVSGPARVILPAVRGLHRAGVGRLLLATAETDAVAATAERLGAEVLPADGAGREADAVLVCREPGHDGPLAGGGGAGDAVVVPVVLGARVLVVGPAGRGPAGPGRTAGDRTEALAARAHTWAEAGEQTAAVRPAADALAGAIAGHLVFEALTRSGTAGEAHVVHGPDLSATRVVLPAPTPPGPDAAEPGDLAAAAPAPAPDPDALVDTVTAIGEHWTGTFALEAAEALPQLPLALRVMADRAHVADVTAAWGADQRGATAAVALAALRGRCGQPGPSATPAAGPTEERWLLDGALRLLTAGTAAGAEGGADAETGTVSVELTARHVAGLESRRLLQALPDAGVPVDSLLLRRHDLPGVGWPLVEVRDRAGGGRLAAAWGRDQEQALHAALATVLAAAQVRGVGDPGPAAPAPLVDTVHTGALLAADEDAVAALRAQLVERAAAHGVRYTGTPGDPDPVLGTLPLWYGTVEAQAAATGGARP